MSLERLELSPTASEAGTLSIALQGRPYNFTRKIHKLLFAYFFHHDSKFCS